jgi:hypothetical protein
VKLTDVIYLPEMENKLLSGGKIAQSGAETILKDDSILVLRKGSIRVVEDAEVFLQGKRREDGLYEILSRVEPNALDQFEMIVNAKANKIKISSNDIHNLFGHLSLSWIKSSESIMEVFEIEETEEDNCDNCNQTKMRRKKFNKKRNEKKAELGERIHTDVIGKISPPAYDWSEYIVEFIEEKSDYTHGEPMKFKSEAEGHLLDFIKFVTTQTKSRVRFVRTDGGGEFTSDYLEEKLRKKGIIHDTTPRDTAQRNGKEENRHRTTFSMTRALLNQSNLPRKYWILAYRHALFIYNLGSPPNEKKSRIELLVGIKTEDLIKHLHRFGESVYYSNNKYKTKLDDRGNEGIWVGYDWRSNVDLVLDVRSKRIVRTRDVNFKSSIIYEFEEEDEGELEEVEDYSSESEKVAERIRQEEEDYEVEEEGSDEKEEEVNVEVQPPRNDLRVRIEPVRERKSKEAVKISRKLVRQERETKKQQQKKIADYSKERSRRVASSKEEDREFWERSASALKITSMRTPSGDEIRIPASIKDDDNLTEGERQLWMEARMKEWKSFIDNEVPVWRKRSELEEGQKPIPTIGIHEVKVDEVL